LGRLPRKFRVLAVIGREPNIQEMSRRSRRRNPGASGGWFGKVAIGLLLAGVLVFAGGYVTLRRYLHSDSFRKFLSVEASDVAGVVGEFAPFHWDGLAVDTESFEAEGVGAVTALKAKGLHTEIGLGGVGRGVWEVRGSSLQRLEVFLDATKQAPRLDSTDVIEKPKKPSRPRWFPSEAELQGMEIRVVSVKAKLEQGPAEASGMNVRLETAGARDAYRVRVQSGSVRTPFNILPEIRLEKLQLRYQDHNVFLTSANLSAWKNGRIEASGEGNLKSRQYSLEGSATGMSCEDLFSEDWAKRITGEIVSTFSMENLTGPPVARGRLELNGGVVTALPLLDALAAYADTRRFRVLNLNVARTDWLWKPGELALTNLVVSSESLVRLEGSLIIRGENLDGSFRLGLAPGTLASIPGAETDVFISGEHGLLWTPLRITGTLDDPKEDLTERLIAAAGTRMFDQIPETGEKVIKFTQSVLGGSSNKVVDKGVKVITEGAGIVREVSGVLDGLLGDPPAEEVEPVEEKR
jgi:hypothetical protein